MGTTVDAGVGLGRLADLEHLLEPAEVVADQLLGARADQLLDRRTRRAVARGKLHLDVDLAAADARSGPELDASAVRQVRPGQRAPRDQAIAVVGDELGVPRELDPTERARDPV